MKEAFFNKADVTFVEPSLIGEYRKTHTTSFIQATSDPIRTYENTFIFKKDDQSLKELFNQEIEQMISTGKIRELISKYTGDQDTFAV